MMEDVNMIILEEAYNIHILGIVGMMAIFALFLLSGAQRISCGVVILLAEMEGGWGYIIEGAIYTLLGVLCLMMIPLLR